MWGCGAMVYFVTSQADDHRKRRTLLQTANRVVCWVIWKHCGWYVLQWCTICDIILILVFVSAVRGVNLPGIGFSLQQAVKAEQALLVQQYVSACHAGKPAVALFEPCTLNLLGGNLLESFKRCQVDVVGH